MKFSFCELFLSLLTIISVFQYQNCFKLCEHKENIYKHLNKPTEQIV